MKETNDKPKEPAALIAVPSGADRNGPCLCGSGKKFKKCCGSGGKVSENYRAERDRIAGEWIQARIAEREEELGILAKVKAEGREGLTHEEAERLKEIYRCRRRKPLAVVLAALAYGVVEPR